MLVEWKSLSDYPFQSFVYSVILFYLYIFKSLYIYIFYYIGYSLIIFKIKVNFLPLKYRMLNYLIIKSVIKLISVYQL